MPPSGRPWHNVFGQRIRTIYARSVALDEISALPEKQHKEGADERCATVGAELQRSHDQRGKPDCNHDKNEQAGPVDERTAASLEARRRSNRNMAV